MVYYQGAGGREERFSFFVLPEDDDGIEDIEELYLYHDLEGLAWRLSADDWVRYEYEEKTWVGTHCIAMAEGESLPRGQFRAVLVDTGGERSERLISFDAPRNPRYAFPSFSIENGRYLIASRYPEHYFVCYDGDGNYIQALAVSVLNDSLESLALPPNTRAVSLWAEDSEYATAALTDIIPLR
jgi:hypothetical protein